jgi:hypothetical protein
VLFQYLGKGISYSTIRGIVVFEILWKENLQPRNVIENVEKLLFLNSLEEKFLGKKFPWKKNSLEKNFLGKKFLGNKFPWKKNSSEKSFLGRRFLGM